MNEGRRTARAGGATRVAAADMVASRGVVPPEPTWPFYVLRVSRLPRSLCRRRRKNYARQSWSAVVRHTDARLPTHAMPTVVVTGSNSGLGLELCRQLVARGDAVYAACRAPSPELLALGVTKVIEGVDQIQESCSKVLADALADVSVDILVNNAGAIGCKPGLTWDEQHDVQTFAALDLDGMKLAFDVNVVGPLRVSKAVAPRMPPGSKIVMISSLMGSVGDNASGGLMAYRCSKSALNQAGVTMARELKAKDIAVGLVHPGMLKTNFGGGIPDSKAKWFRPVDGGARGVIEAIDALTMETTGGFIHGNYGNGLKPCPW
jgi:NAD(P)-dependent dehydrogenase (short-subunit alcohol dehydrogenase family)